MIGEDLGEDRQFAELLRAAGALRPAYPASLGPADPKWRTILSGLGEPVPRVHEIIYSRVSGTRREAPDQRLVDFFPGFRLIHIRELELETKNLERMGYPRLLPFLADYSSDYCCAAPGGAIVATDHELGVETKHDSAARFLESMLSFYANDVLFLDPNGMLDYHVEKYRELAAELNPGVPYWAE